MRYGIWNNKGGVGKTFLSFILGTEYANAHPDRRVILADMCPQANLSEIVLGGNGKGGDALAGILAQGKGRKTIGGYLDLRIESPHQISGSETEFLLRLKDYNTELPENLYLVCGVRAWRSRRRSSVRLGARYCRPMPGRTCGTG